MLEQSPAEYYMPNQFDNPHNALAHYETTGPELLDADRGHDRHVRGRHGHDRHADGRRAASCTSTSPARASSASSRRSATRSRASRTCRRPSAPKIYDPSVLDDKVTVFNDEAFEATRRLAAEEGIFVGMSSGAALAGASAGRPQARARHESWSYCPTAATAT